MVSHEGLEILERVAELRRARRAAVLITVTVAKGSTPRKAGARMLVFADGSIEGTIGGGKVEHAATQLAGEVLAARQPRAQSYALGPDLGMSCGGEMSLFFEPLLTDPPLVVFGCGHVGRALIRAAKPLGFDIVAVDDLRDNANPERLPEASTILNSYAPDALAEIPFSDETYLVVVTREHKFDLQMIEACLGKPFAYLGVIGSPRKAKLQRERLVAAGHAPEQIARVRCPVGLDIGAETPEEIAVAILAQIIEVRRGGPKFARRASPEADDAGH